MGTNSGLFARRVIDNTYQVLAIELLTIVQAIDYLNMEGRMASFTRDKYSIIRSIVPRFEEDTIKYIELKRIKDYLCSQFITIQ
jgi:histidine ammonia-lyase